MVNVKPFVVRVIVLPKARISDLIHGGLRQGNLHCGSARKQCAAYVRKEQYAFVVLISLDKCILHCFADAGSMPTSRTA